MRKESYGGFQFFKDVNFQTDQSLQPIIKRPRWKEIDKDEGVAFYEKKLPDKRVKHMDIIKGVNRKGENYKSVTIYEVGEENNSIMFKIQKENNGDRV